MYKILLFLLFLIHCSSFTITFNRIFSNNNILKPIRVFETRNQKLENLDCIIFFTGASSFIRPDIYSNFLKELTNNNISVYVPSFRYENLNYLVKKLKSEYKNVLMMGHSSGCTYLLNNCENVNDIILLDGVNTNLFNSTKKYDVKHVDNILFLYADKSYKFTFDPPGIPFIPFLSITENNLLYSKNHIMYQTNALNYGHSDILDEEWSNFMHNTRLSVGNKERDNKKYHKIMSKNIKYFINGEYDKILREII